MDNLTHSLVGALIGQTGLKRKTGLAMPALIIGANLPDVDASCFLWLEGTEHLAFRRGITHGPPALVLLPLVLAGLLWAFDRWQAKRGKRPEGRLPVRFGWLFALAFIGCLTHPALDWMNTYGIRLLEPFSSRWFYGDTLFIIDVWLWALLVGSTWLSLRREKKGGNWRGPARFALAAILIYIAGNNAFSQLVARTALATPSGSVPAPVAVIASPVPLMPWAREVLAMDEDYRWYTSSFTLLGGAGEAIQLAPQQCGVNGSDLPVGNSQVDAFLFWSRAPVFVAQGDGVMLRDARFFDRRVSNGFMVDLPATPCAEPLAE